jgi:hypothetical protein
MNPALSNKKSSFFDLSLLVLSLFLFFPSSLFHLIYLRSALILLFFNPPLSLLSGPLYLSIFEPISIFGLLSFHLPLSLFEPFSFFGLILSLFDLSISLCPSFFLSFFGLSLTLTFLSTFLSPFFFFFSFFFQGSGHIRQRVYSRWRRKLLRWPCKRTERHASFR